MNKLKKVSVEDLFALLPDSKINEIAECYEVDKYVSKLRGKLMLKLMLYSQFSLNDMSLRSIQEQYSSTFFQILSDNKSEKITHGAIRDRLKKIPSTFFKEIYDLFYEQLSKLYDDTSLEKYHLKRYDSTLVRTSAKLLGGEGLKVSGKTKAKSPSPQHVKFTTEMLGDFLLDIKIYTAQKYASEDNALGEAILSTTHKSEQVVIFDRGLKDRKAFIALDNSDEKAKTFFVTRIYKNSKVTFIKSISSKEQLRKHPTQYHERYDDEKVEFLEDNLVYLHSGQRSEKISTPLRLIKIRRFSDDEEFSIVTNIIDGTAFQIANIYRKRWDIEVLFRFLKQEMNLNHILCHDSNAMQNVIYLLLIAAMMILIYRKLNKIKSYKTAKNRFFKELQDIILFQIISTPDGIEKLKHIIENRIFKE